MLVQQLKANINRIFVPQTASTFGRAFPRQLFSTMSLQSSKTCVAISQMCANNDKAENLRKVKRLVEMAKNKKAKFLFLPECCDFVGENRQETLALSEPLTGPTVAAYAQLAKDNNMWLSLGGVHESILDSTGAKMGKMYNAHVIIDSLGNIGTVYRKLHLFDVATPDFHFRESEVVAKGDRIVPPIQTPAGKLGLQICYDVRFPEVSTQLRKLGAEILAYPSAFAFATGKAHWHVLLRSRAIENQCYVIAAAQIGFHNKKRQSYGHALIVDPWGKVIATNEERELDIAVAEIDLEKVYNVRKNMPCFEHRRSDVYNLTAIDSSELEGVDREFSYHIIPKETIFFESPHCYVFTNIRCVVKGHVLVSSKRVVPRLLGLNGDEMTDLFRTVGKIQEMLEDIYQTSSATVTVQDGPDAGQTVKHVHFHIMPRSPGDFDMNDQIYVQLEKFSKETEDRKITDMIAEAQMYRDYLAKEKTKHLK